MSTYSSVKGLPEEWDVATSPWEEPLRLSYERRYRGGDGYVLVQDQIFIEKETAERICRQLANVLEFKLEKDCYET